MRHPGAADEFLGDALGFERRESGHAVRAEVADVDDALHARVGGGLGQVLGAVNVGGEQVPAFAVSLGAGEVDDVVHAAEGGAQAARVVEAGNRHLERDAGRKPRRARRGADQRPQGVSRVEHVTDEGAADESRPTGDEEHAVIIKDEG